MTMCKKMTH